MPIDPKCTYINYASISVDNGMRKSPRRQKLQLIYLLRQFVERETEMRVEFIKFMNAHLSNNNQHKSSTLFRLHVSSVFLALFSLSAEHRFFFCCSVLPGFHLSPVSILNYYNYTVVDCANRFLRPFPLRNFFDRLKKENVCVHSQW